MATDRWQYAYRSVLEEDVKRRLYMWSWKRMKKHRLVREGEGEKGREREKERRGRGRRRERERREKERKERERREKGRCVYWSWHIVIGPCVKNTSNCTLRN